MVTQVNPFVQDGPVGSYRATRSPAGGFRIEITLTNCGSVPLVDVYQFTTADLESVLLHPHEAPEPFLACPGVGAPGWTSLGLGLLPNQTAGPFVAWCAKSPERFMMRWCAEDPSVGGTFEIRGV